MPCLLEEGWIREPFWGGSRLAWARAKPAQGKRDFEGATEQIGVSGAKSYAARASVIAKTCLGPPVGRVS